MTTKYNYFEGLRGALAFIVVIHHFVLLFYPKLYIGTFNLQDFVNNPYSINILLANTPLNLFMNGSWAVSMFFTLSGFVLSKKYIATNDITALQQGIVKRYFRLALPILITVLFVYLLHFFKVFKNTPYPRNMENFEFGKTLFANHLSFIETIKMALFEVPFKGDNTYLPVLWTMEIELSGALIVFAFLLSTHLLKNKLIFYSFLILILMLLNRNYLVMFVCGSFICVYEDQIKNIFKKNYSKLFILIIGIYLAGIPNIANSAKQHTMYWYTCVFSPYIYIKFQLVSCVLLFSYLISATTPKKILSNKVLQFFGKISFSIYLLHLPILFIMGTNMLIASKGKINSFVLFFSCITVITIFAYIFYFFVDLKTISFTNKLAKKLIKT